MNTLTYEVTGRIARITLNRPERGNAITLDMPRELAACVERRSATRPRACVWGCPTTALWAYRVGIEKVKRLLFTGDCLSGKEAVEWGLAVECAPAEQLDERFEILLERIARMPINQLVMKLLVNQTLGAAGLQATQILGPEDCLSADAWWGIDGEATLLQSLFAIFDGPFVTRAAFEPAMVRFADAGFPHGRSCGTRARCRPARGRARLHLRAVRAGAWRRRLVQLLDPTRERPARLGARRARHAGHAGLFAHGPVLAPSHVRAIGHRGTTESSNLAACGSLEVGSGSGWG